MEIKDLFRELKYPIELFDKNGNLIYWERYGGRWWVRECDNNGNEIYYKNSKDYWEKREYDKYDKPIYYETSEYGVILDKRPKPNKVININGVDIELTQETINKIKEALEN